MSHRVLVTVIFALFILILLICIFFFRASILPQSDTLSRTEQHETETSPREDKKELSVDRISEIENALEKLEAKNADQDKEVETLSKKMSKTATPSGTVSSTKTLTTASAQGSVFTTTSTIYTPMSLYVNVTCPQKCILWTNFYTSSKNADTPDAVNTYGLFLNGGDTSVYNKATIPVANNAVPVSLNAALPVGAGTHTVEIKAKTSGGTLQSDISYLQVMVIEN